MIRVLPRRLSVAGGVLLAVAAAVLGPRHAAAQPWRAWAAQGGLVTLVLVGDARSALVGETAPEPTTGSPRSQLVLVDAASARTVWAQAYRNSNCCGLPAVGWLDGRRRAFAAGDELVVATLGGAVVARLDLDGTALDVAAAAGRILVGLVRVRPGAVAHDVVAVEAGRVLWRVGFPQVAAVALSPEGPAAVASLTAVAGLDGRTGRIRWQMPQEGVRLVDLAFAPGALLVIAQKTATGTCTGSGWRVPGLRWPAPPRATPRYPTASGSRARITRARRGEPHGGGTDAVIALALAVLCCALPLLVVAGVSIGAGAVLGAAVPVLVGLAVVGYVVVQATRRWRRSAAGRLSRSRQDR